MPLASFSQKQRDYYFRSKQCWLNVAEGGVRAGKNVLNVLSFCHAVETNPSRIHLIMGVSVSAARMFVVDCDGLGVLYHFAGRYREGKFKSWDCIYVTTAYGAEKIILVHGANNVLSERRIKGATVGCVYITEANECDENTVIQTLRRTMSVPVPKHFHDLNPKPEGHWYYREVLDFHAAQQKKDANYGYNYGHFTIWDNLSVADEHLEREIAKHDQNGARYKRDILGKRVALEGLVYAMFNYDFHVVKTEPRPYSKWYAGVDYGHSNATAMGLFGLAGNTWYLVKEYYHSERDTNQPRTATQYYQELERLCEGRNIEQVIVDPSAKAFINEIRSKGKFRVRQGRNDVKPGIDAVSNALESGEIRVNSCCTNTIREFGLYRWNEKSADDVPIKDNDHCMDFIRYFAYTLGIGRKRRTGGGIVLG